MECPFCGTNVQEGDACGSCGVGMPSGSGEESLHRTERAGGAGRAKREIEESRSPGPSWENGVRRLEDVG